MGHLPGLWRPDACPGDRVSVHRDQTTREVLAAERALERALEHQRRRIRELEEELRRANVKLRALLPYDEHGTILTEGEAW
jgi:hypothetical protein